MLAVAALVTSACGSGDTASGSAKDTVTVSQGVDVSTLDPQMGTGTMTDMSVLSNIFDFLTKVDDDGQVQPELATSWKPVGDGSKWQFDLRHDVTFQNGEPFNAEAVKFTFDRLNDPETHSPLSAGGLMTGVKVVDDDTVEFSLAYPDPYLPSQLSLFIGAIIPPKYVTEKGAEYFAENPVGTGPFSFVSWKRGDRVTLKANDTYWGEVPKIDNLVFRNIPNAADAAAALRAGEIDVNSNIDADTAAEFKGDSKIDVRAVPGVRTFMLSLDADQGGPLENVKVRQAINHAVDMDTIVATLKGATPSAPPPRCRARARRSTPR